MPALGAGIHALNARCKCSRGWPAFAGHDVEKMLFWARILTGQPWDKPGGEVIFSTAMRQQPDLSFERQMGGVVCGIDEAGRGP